jgi:hypothetical protein
MEALFGGDAPLLDRSALRDLHSLPEQRYWLLQDLQALLEHRALRGPMLVCLDDQHWADSGTAAALRALPSRLRALPIGWMMRFAQSRAQAGSSARLSISNGTGPRRLSSARSMRRRCHRSRSTPWGQSRMTLSRADDRCAWQPVPADRAPEAILDLVAGSTPETPFEALLSLIRDRG